MPNIKISSIVSVRDGEPYVHVEIDDKHVQLTPEDAREQASFLLRAAEAADTDKMLYNFVMTDLKGDKETAAAMLVMLRKYREQRDWNPLTTKVIT